MEYIIRNHDLTLAKKQCQDFENIAAFLNQKYGYPMVKVTIEQSYLNMREHIEQHMYIVDNAMAAMNVVLNLMLFLFVEELMVLISHIWDFLVQI